jgi:hypothetical protein
MVQVIQNDAQGILECFLGRFKSDPVLLVVFGILGLIPVERSWIINDHIA